MLASYLDFDLFFEASGGPNGIPTTTSNRDDTPFRSSIRPEEVLRILIPQGSLDSSLFLTESEESLSGRLAASPFGEKLREKVSGARRAARSANQRTRLRLRFEGAEELDMFPWEAMVYRATSAGFDVSADLSVFRHVPVDGPTEPVLASPLRILAVLASPQGLPPFDVKREWWDLRRTLRPLVERGLVELELLPETSESCLRELRGKVHHVVHFVGYGRSDVQARYGSLFLEGREGGSRAITADYLAPLLWRDLSTKLVVLNVGGRSTMIHPFGETARTFVRSGLPAVLAMRRALSAEASLPFFESLYTSLASGLPIDVSVANGRRLLTEPTDGGAWATPLLYACSGAGLQFEPAAGSGSVLQLGNSVVEIGATNDEVDESRPRAVLTSEAKEVGSDPGSGGSPESADSAALGPGDSPEYLDFAIKIEPRNNHGYPVLVIGSPAGEDRGTLRSPVPFQEIADQVDRLGSVVRGSSKNSPVDRNFSLTPPTLASAPSPQDVGSRLFHSLFSEPVLRLFDRSLGAIGEESPHGLRLSLHFSIDHPDLALLASLPWELLYSEDQREYLCLAKRTPIVRTLDVPRPARVFRFGTPLRILIASAGPSSFPALDTAEERARIEQSWARLPGVEVDFVDHVSPPQLRLKLSEKPFHILHFMGHGGFLPETGEGFLSFEGAGSREAPLPGQVLGDLLRDFSSLNLVLLNACDTARSARQGGLDPFAGVASALVMAGLPAVVAMQFPISDGAAVAFSTAFYQRLAAGDAIDAAVVEGRMAIRLNDPASLEWATPVLFLRGTGGSFSR